MPKRLLLPLLIFMLTALACNFPVAKPPSLFDDYTPGAPQVTAVPGTPAAQAVTATAPQPGQTPVYLQSPVPVAPDGSTYLSQPGDTLEALAGRYAADLQAVRLPDGVSAAPADLLPAGMLLGVPPVSGETLPGTALLPDGEVVYGPAARDFDVAAFIQQAGGYLATYSEQVNGETLSGAAIVRRVAMETSINPRLLLGLLEYRAGWVFGAPRPGTSLDYPIGFNNSGYRGLHKELTLTARYLTIGYYGWRAGTLPSVRFPDGFSARPAPQLNPGSVALQNLFALLHRTPRWAELLYGPENFPLFYSQRFGDPWARAAQAGPLFPDGLQPPTLELPFLPGGTWSFTGGPHIAWGVGSPLGALDFAPVGKLRGCNVSEMWATASAAGLVVRSERGQLVLDLDGDGSETTGWTLLYLHLADKDRLPVGSRVSVDQPLGHPSCEGGNATGAHVHLSRRYNGEWIGVGDTLPFVVSGWRAFAGEYPYLGELRKDGLVISARSNGSAPARLVR